MYLGYIICGFVLIVALIISACAQTRVFGTFNKYKNVDSALDMTGAELAQRLAYEKGVDINIAECSGSLTDNYNSATKTLNISRENFNSKSLAAHAIVAHEFGHALQDKEGYRALILRQIVIKVSNFASRLLVPILILGLLMEFLFFSGGVIIIYVYVGLYAFSVLVNLVTLPVEYNASSRAKKLLRELGCNSSEQVRGTEDLLNAAALTYVASLLVSMVLFLRMLLLLFSIRRD